MTFFELIGMIVVVALVACSGLAVAKLFGTIAGIAMAAVVAIFLAVVILWHWERDAHPNRNEKKKE